MIIESILACTFVVLRLLYVHDVIRELSDCVLLYLDYLVLVLDFIV